MAKLLLIFLIIIGIGYIISFMLKRAVKNFFNIDEKQVNKSQKKENESKVIYRRDDVVVMKGDAPNHTNNNS